MPCLGKDPGTRVARGLLSVVQVCAHSPEDSSSQHKRENAFACLLRNPDPLQLLCWKKKKKEESEQSLQYINIDTGIVL